MQRNHALTAELGAAPRLRVEVILSLAAHQNLAVFRDLEAFEICLD